MQSRNSKKSTKQPLYWLMMKKEQDMISLEQQTQELDLTADSTEATLTGWTVGQSSILIHGTDAVRIVPSKKK